MKTNTTNYYKLKILHKVAEKILRECGFTTSWKDFGSDVYENPETSIIITLKAGTSSVDVTNMCRGTIQLDHPLILSLLRDGRFIFNKDCPLMLHSNPALSLEAVWESVSHFLTEEETVEIFQGDRPAKLAEEALRRKLEAPNDEITPLARPIPSEEFI